MPIYAETNPAKAALALVNGQRPEIVVPGNLTGVSERLAQLGITLASPESGSQTNFPGTPTEACAFLGLPSSVAEHIHPVNGGPGEPPVGFSVDAAAAQGSSSFEIPTGGDATVCLDTPFVSPLITDLPTLRRMVQYYDENGNPMQWVRADLTWGNGTSVLVHPHQGAQFTMYGGLYHGQKVQCDTQAGNNRVLYRRQGKMFLPQARTGFGSTQGVPAPQR